MRESKILEVAELAERLFGLAKEEALRLSEDTTNIRLRALSSPSKIEMVENSGKRETIIAAKQEVARRRIRNTTLCSEHVCDAYWDVLLDLFVASMEGQKISITSACIASGVPATTALRLLRLMEKDGVLIRHSDPHDGRRSFVDLSEHAKSQVRATLVRFSEIERGATAA